MILRVLLFALLLAGCVPHAPVPTEHAQLGAGQRFRGPLTIIVVDSAKEAALECQALMAKGCYQADRQRIVTVADVYILIHELKHYFEGPWH